MTPAEQPILQLRGLGRAFGGIVAVDDFSLDVRQGAIHGLIGPNGAGKTTTFNVISGFYAPSRGKVIYLGEDISGAEDERARRARADPHLSGHDLVSRAERARQCPPRLPSQRQGPCLQPRARQRPEQGKGSRLQGRSASSSSSACTILPTSSPPTCPMVISARSAWPSRLPPIRS